MIVALGFIVGFIVVSMFLPLVKIIENLQSGGLDDDSKSGGATKE